MPSARKILAKSTLSIGIALGAIAGGAWFYLMWETATAETAARTSMNAFWLGAAGAVILLALITWPFAKLAECIDPPPPAGGQAPVEPLTTARRSRPARSTVSKPAKR